MEELIRVVKPWETEFRITKDSHKSSLLLDEKHNQVLNFPLKKCDTWPVTEASQCHSILKTFPTQHTMFRFEMIQTSLP